MKTSFKLTFVLFNFCLLFTCCHQLNSAKNDKASHSRTKLQSKDKNQNAPTSASKTVQIDDALQLDEEMIIEPPRTAEPAMSHEGRSFQEPSSSRPSNTLNAEAGFYPPPPPPIIEEVPEEEIEEGYRYQNTSKVVVNGFKDPNKNPLSTFSIDVDQASYSQVREIIMNGEIPPANMVRIEEMINYFDYDYPNPKGEIPFSVNTEISSCPWNTQHQLVHIGLQGRKVPKENVPANNLVFLLDVSGSMNAPNKLPLLKKGFQMLINELRPQDRVAIVVYAGRSGIVLNSTSGTHKQQIKNAMNQLQSGGGTAGAEGIELAYQIAKQHFVKDGNNRIILATDGDFNVGPSSQQELIHLIEQKRNQGIYLSVLGFGMNHYGDERMEQLADNGNGNYAYIDNVQEARKVLVKEFSSTLFTIAKDVKLQIEFNPTQVKGYRLIGYENRILADRDFNDDKKDAGELGAGHSVTALYEIILANSDESITANVDDLRYQQTAKVINNPQDKEWMTIKLRYKKPNSSKSQKIVTSIRDEGLTLTQTSNNFRFSAAVAGFGMLLKDDPSIEKMSFNTILGLAQNARGADKSGYRAEFIRMLELTGTLKGIDQKTAY